MVIRIIARLTIGYLLFVTFLLFSLSCWILTNSRDQPRHHVLRAFTCSVTSLHVLTCYAKLIYSDSLLLLIAIDVPIYRYMLLSYFVCIIYYSAIHARVLWWKLLCRPCSMSDGAMLPIRFNFRRGHVAHSFHADLSSFLLSVSQPTIRSDTLVSRNQIWHVWTPAHAVPGV